MHFFLFFFAWFIANNKMITKWLILYCKTSNNFKHIPLMLMLFQTSNETFFFLFYKAVTTPDILLISLKTIK